MVQGLLARAEADLALLQDAYGRLDESEVLSTEEMEAKKRELKGRIDKGKQALVMVAPMSLIGIGIPNEFDMLHMTARDLVLSYFRFRENQTPSLQELVDRVKEVRESYLLPKLPPLPKL